jgi:hypothetical protein
MAGSFHRIGLFGVKISANFRIHRVYSTPKRREEEVVYAHPPFTFALKIHGRHCVSANWEEALACKPLE